MIAARKGMVARLAQALVTDARVAHDPAVKYTPWWAVGGIVITFATAIFRLGERGYATIRAGLGPAEWLALLFLTIALVYGEGIRALSRRWVPFVIDRAAALRTEPRLFHRLVGPLYAMGLVGAPRRTALRAWAGVFAIAAAVLIVRALPEPWRGMIDFAVAAALVCGLLAILVQAWRRLR